LRSQEVNKRKNHALQQIVYDITKHFKECACVDHYNATSDRTRKLKTALNCNRIIAIIAKNSMHRVPSASDAAKHKANNILSTRATFKKAPTRSK